MRLRISGRHDSVLLAGFSLALLVTFQPAIQSGLDVARDIERTYGLALMPTFMILSVMLIFHHQAKRREMKAEAAAAAIEATAARSRAEELEQLMMFGQALARALSVDAVREVVWRHLPPLAGGDDVAWVVLNSEAGWSRLTDLSATTWRPGELESIADTALEAGPDGDTSNGVTVAGQVCFVMRVRAEPVGVLGLPVKNASPDVRGRMATAAALLTIAARNAQLFSDIRETSVKDSLTGCFNRGYALDCLEAEFARSRRTRLPLSIVMFDIDRFKEVNDRYGHLAGDAMLEAVGGRLCDLLRRSDLRCRYGGDEFLVILPDTNVDGAWHVAEALRKEIAALQLAREGSPLAVTITAGVACAAPEDRSARSLVQRADEALYAAKAAGRNCVRASRVGEQSPADIVPHPTLRLAH